MVQVAQVFSGNQTDSNVDDVDGVFQIILNNLLPASGQLIHIQKTNRPHGIDRVLMSASPHQECSADQYDCQNDNTDCCNQCGFIAVAFGGAILGAGLSIILKSGGCIDGSEIFANILLDKIYQKTGKKYSMALILVIFNVCVYSVIFIYMDQNAALLSLLVFIVATTVINHFTDHFEAIKQVTIITKDPDKIIKDIKEDLNKTCTVIDSSGAIAGENKTLICFVSYFELGKIKHIINNNEGSFSTVSTIDEIIS